MAVKILKKQMLMVKVYKVTAVADNLVQPNASNNFNEVYTYYIEKPKAKEDNVYYDLQN